MDGLGHEVVPAFHAPRHDGLITFRPEGELRGAGAGEGLEELHLDPDQVARAALRQRHAAFSYLGVARPGVDGADSGRSALVALLHPGIELRPRIPGVPLAEIIHL